MGKDHNWGRARERSKIAFQPAQLLRAQSARGIELQHIVEPDEVHVLMCEAVPAVAERALAEAFPIKNAIVECGVVLARNVERLPNSGTLDDLLSRIELRRF